MYRRDRGYGRVTAPCNAAAESRRYATITAASTRSLDWPLGSHRQMRFGKLLPRFTTRQRGRAAYDTIRTLPRVTSRRPQHTMFTYAPMSSAHAIVLMRCAGRAYFMRDAADSTIFAPAFSSPLLWPDAPAMALAPATASPLLSAAQARTARSRFVLLRATA